MTQNAAIRITTLSFIFSFRLLVFAGPPSGGEGGDVRNCAAGPRSKARKICEKGQWVDRVNELSVIQKLLAQLLFQIPTRGFFDGATLRRDCFLFCPSLRAGSDIDVSRQMRNLWPTCADFSFIWFRVRIHRGNYQT